MISHGIKTTHYSLRCNVRVGKPRSWWRLNWSSWREWIHFLVTMFVSVLWLKYPQTVTGAWGSFVEQFRNIAYFFVCAPFYLSESHGFPLHRQSSKKIRFSFLKKEWFTAKLLWKKAHRLFFLKHQGNKGWWVVGIFLTPQNSHSTFYTF